MIRIASVAVGFGALGLVVMLVRLRREWRDGTLRPLFLMSRTERWTRGYIYEVLIGSCGVLGMGISGFVGSRTAAACSLCLLPGAYAPTVVLAIWNPSWLSPPWARSEESLRMTRRKRRSGRGRDGTLA